MVATVLLPAALALIMATLGLSLEPADFTRLFRRPVGVLIGLANLVVLSPLLALAIAELYDLDAVFAVGLVLLGASPGGTLANFLTHLARGDTALSITMTALSSVAAVVTVPLYLSVAIDHFDASVGSDVGMAGVVARVFAVTIVPLAAGMAIRRRDPARAAALEPRAKRLAFAVFVTVVAGAIVSEFDRVTGHFAELALATLTLNLAAMTLSFGIARLARLDDRQATAISIELGVHNAALAIAVGASIDDALAIPAAVYSVFQLFTAGAFARVMHRRNAGRPSPSPRAAFGVSPPR